MMKFARQPAWILAAAIAVGAASPAAAQNIYKYVDENGNVVFTDRAPTPDSKPMTLRELSVVETPTYPTRTAPGGAEAEEAEGPSLNELRRRYRGFRLVSPEPEQSFWGTGQVATIAWDSSVALSDELSTIFYVNNEPVTGPTRATSFNTAPMDRGEHRARVDLVTADNSVVASAGPVTFFIRQNSRQFNPGR